MEQALTETQTLCASCSKAEPKKFAPPQYADPLPGGVGRPKFNQLEMVTIYTTFTYKPMQFGEDRCTQFRFIVVTDPRTNKHTRAHTHTNPYTGPITLRRSFASAQCNPNSIEPHMYQNNPGHHQIGVNCCFFYTSLFVSPICWATFLSRPVNRIDKFLTTDTEKSSADMTRFIGKTHRSSQN